MNFEGILNGYMSQYDISLSALARQSGLPKSTLSRYRNGQRVPQPGTEAIKRIAKGIAEAAFLSGKKADSEAVRKKLDSASRKDAGSFNYELFSTKLDALISAVDVNVRQMCMFSHIEPSTISRIRKGKCRPRDPMWIAETVANYVSRNFSGMSDMRRIMDHINAEKEPESREILYEQILYYLTGDGPVSEEPEKGFFHRETAFDTDEYFSSLNAGTVKLSYGHAKLPSSKQFSGAEGMEQSILCFLKAASSSQSMRDVVIYNDHPMEMTFSKSEFLKQWIRGIGMLVLKGLHIHVIHNISQSEEVLLPGLEQWIPLYMTGQITPYYTETQTSVFHHLLIVAGSAAVSGMAVRGHADQGEYFFQKNAQGVQHCRTQADQILTTVSPLIDVYRKARRRELYSLLEAGTEEEGLRKNYLDIPPIYTISDELLEKILTRSNVSERDKKEIFSFVEKERKRFAGVLKNTQIQETIYITSKEEFARYPLALPLELMFRKENIYYTYDEYTAHMQETRNFGACNENYILRFSHNSYYRNIQIRIHEGSMVIISKAKAPHVHFVISNPKIVKAFFDLEEPLRQRMDISR